MTGKALFEILAMLMGFCFVVGLLTFAELIDSATINAPPWHQTPHNTYVATYAWGNELTGYNNDTGLNTQLNAVCTVAVACSSRTPIPSSTPVPTLPSVTPIPTCTPRPTDTPIPADTPVAIDPLSVTSLVVNDAGTTGKNTRMETNNIEYALFVDATNDRVMLGIATPHASYYTGTGVTAYRNLGTTDNAVAYALGSETTLNGTVGTTYQCAMAVKDNGNCADGKTGTAIGFEGSAWASAVATPAATPALKIGVSGVTAPLAGWTGIGVLGYPLLQNTSGTVAKTWGVYGGAPIEPAGGSMTVTAHYSVYGEDPSKNGNAAGYSGYFEQDVYVGGDLSGCRESFRGCADATQNADGYMSDGLADTSTTRGYRALRAGKVIGITVRTNCSAAISASTATIHVYVAGASIMSSGAISCGATGDKTISATATRATATAFSAGDILAIYCDLSADPPTIINTIADVEIVYDN